MTYVNPGSMLAIAIIFPVLGMVALSLRCYVRAARKQGLGLDDMFSGLALIFTIAAGIVIMTGVAEHIFGYHSPTHRPHSMKEMEEFKNMFVSMQKLNLGFDLTQYLALGMTKLSIMFFYRRIFRGRAFEILSWILVGLSILWTVAWFFLALFQCGGHVDYLWGFTKAYGPSCMSGGILLFTNVLTDVILDLSILILPIPLVCQLQMPLRQKISVITIFLFGVFSLAAGLVRFAAILDAQILGKQESFGVKPGDSFAADSLMSFWAYIEVGVAMLISCLMTLRGLLEKKELQAFFRAVSRTPLLSSLASFTQRSWSSRSSSTRRDKDGASYVSDGSAFSGSKYYRMGSPAKGKGGASVKLYRVDSKSTISAAGGGQISPAKTYYGRESIGGGTLVSPLRSPYGANSIGGKTLVSPIKSPYGRTSIGGSKMDSPKSPLANVHAMDVRI